jgi:hypothetical protein
MVPAAMLMASSTAGCSRASAGSSPGAEAPASPPSSKQVLVFTPRTLALEDFPCSQCHNKIEGAENPAGPVSSPHRGLLFDHMPAAKKCDQCHALNDMDSLQLIDGNRVSFDDSARLCGQCHMQRFKDWQIGAHGKRVGNFMGATHVYSCVECHRAHAPAFQHTQPKAPPPRPKLAIDKGTDKDKHP